MPTDRVDTTRPEYSWIPFFEELARRLHEDGWRDRQAEIVAELKRMKDDGLMVNKWVENMDELIDPFSIFGMIIRVGFDNALDIMQAYKTFFGISAGLPKEEPFVPSIQPVDSFFFPEELTRSQIDPHWNLFGHIMSNEFHNDTSFDNHLATLLNSSLEVKRVGQAKLTGALYWIQPHRFLKTDTINRSIGNADYSDFGRTYLERLSLVRERDQRPLPLINNEGRLVDEFLKTPDVAGMWMIVAGKSNVFADEFLDGGFSAIGWEHDLDPTDYDTAEDMKKVLKPIWPTTFDEIARFHKEIKRGDVIVMRNPNTGELRYGFAGSFGTYSVNVRHLQDRRGVHWRPADISFEGMSSVLPRSMTVAAIDKARETLMDEIKVAEGLSPVDENGNEPPEGALVDPGAEAPPMRWPSDDIFIEEDEQLRMLSLLQRKQNLILQGPPGTGKTFIARKLAYALMGEAAPDRIASVQFHQSYSYEDFVGGFRPSVNDDNQLVFKAEDGAFLRLCERAREDGNNDYVMLIDEINRGNLSRVFGELMMLIEPDKRKVQHAVQLQHRLQMPDHDDDFFVPENVYIIGTMNLADRSLTGMNVAMRRRFGFVTLEPQFGSQRFRDWMQRKFANGSKRYRTYLDEVINRMTALNVAIERHDELGPQYKVGHSFFVPDPKHDPPNGKWEDWYQMVVKHEVHPLLEEYWVDNQSVLKEQLAALNAPLETEDDRPDA